MCNKFLLIKFMKISPFKIFCTPANAVSLFENRYFLSHRPPMKFMKISPFKIFCTHPNAVSSYENRHFLSHRPPIKIRKSACFIFHVLRPLLLLRVKATRFLCSFQNQKSANVDQFYFSKTSILYKVAPRNSLCR